MKTTLLALGLLAGVSTAALAEDSDPCKGHYTVVRKSEIIDGGSMAGFLEAAKDQQAWYRANGVTKNEIIASPVVLVDEASGATSVSDKLAMTFHVNAPGPDMDLPKGNEGWNAFVAKYEANSKILETTLVCWSE